MFLSRTSELAKYPEGNSFVAAAMAAVQGAHGRVIDQTNFPPANVDPAEYCRRRLSEASHYVGIIGFRYGDTVQDQDKSYVRMEFDTAISLERVCYAFLLDDHDDAILRIPVPYLSDPEHQREQEEFRKWVEDESGVTLKRVREPEELARFLIQALSDERDQNRADPSPEQPPLWDSDTFPVLASKAEQQLRSALRQLRDAVDIMDRVEHSYAGPREMDDWAWADRISKHRDLAISVPGPATELKDCLAQVATDAKDARTAVESISERPPRHVSELTSIVGRVSELQRSSQLLVDRIASARNELVRRSADYPDYGPSCEILFQVYKLIDVANSDATRMERTLSSLYAAPEAAATPDASPAAERPSRSAASSPRPTAVVSPVEYIGATSPEDGRPLKATATTPQTERTPDGPDSVPVAAGLLSGGGLVALQVDGVSMEGAGINDRDYVIADTEQTAQGGDIVVVTMEGSGDVPDIIVKKLLKNADGSDRLVSVYTDRQEDVPIPPPGQKARIDGKVVGIFRPFPR